jgi:hypothetical protein
MILNKLRKRRLMQFSQYVAEFGGFRFAGGEGRAVDSSQGADEGIAVLSADFPILVAMSVIDAHGKSFKSRYEKVRTTIEFCSRAVGFSRKELLDLLAR